MLYDDPQDPKGQHTVRLPAHVHAAAQAAALEAERREADTAKEK